MAESSELNDFLCASFVLFKNVAKSLAEGIPDLSIELDSTDPMLSRSTGTTSRVHDVVGRMQRVFYVQFMTFVSRHIGHCWMMN